MLLRRGGTASAVLSIALLVAIIASTTSVANHLSLQSQALSSLVNPGRTLLILSRNAASLSDSSISAEQALEIAGKMENLSWVKQATPQKLLTAKIASEAGNATANIRLVDDAAAFLKMRNARLNGTISGDKAIMGEILARLLAVNIGDEIAIHIHEAQIRLRISGVFRSQTEIDSEIIAPMQLLKNFTGEITLIELVLAEKTKVPEALNHIGRILPENLRVIQAQQPLEFAQQTIRQTLNFLNLWFTVVYIAIAAASYVIAGRLTAESDYEFTMLKTLGASRNQLSMIIIMYTVMVAVSGAMLGAAIGTVGAQAASTIFRWINPTIDLAPFPEPLQIIQTTLITLAASILGCIYPAIKMPRQNT